MTVVVGTAGHIDHGKTALLRALTGIDADRLPEERRRGMTIDVGYAHMRLTDGSELDFVDVPGHDRLVGNMLVGAGEIDAAMIVVAADEGPQAQTLEHLGLLDALGIDDGLAVLTKLDLLGASDPRRSSRPDEVRAMLAPTPLAAVPIVAVSATSGEGIGELRLALEQLRERVATRMSRTGGARLAIDRVFTARGRGVVVTGSLRGGRITRGDTLRLEPGGGSVRVREIQVHGAAVETVHDGGRVALNLAGTDRDALARGMVLCVGPAVRSTTRLLVSVRLATAATPRSRAGGHPVRIHLGTNEVMGRLRLAAASSAAEGVEEGTRDGLGALLLDRPVATAIDDRFVMREPSPAGTIGGGRVLDVAPPAHLVRRRLNRERLAVLAAAVEPIERFRALLAAHGLVDAALAATYGAVGGKAASQLAEGAGAVRLTRVFADPDLVAEAEEAVIAAVAAAEADPHGSSVRVTAVRAVALARLRHGAPGVAVRPDDAAALVQRLVDAGRLAQIGDTVRDPARAVALPAAVLEAMNRLVARLATPTPPPLATTALAAGCPPEGLRALLAEGRIVRVEPDLAYAADTFAALEAVALRLASAGPLTPAAYRDATGTSRRYALAMLEELDARGLLRRGPDGHLLGPMAPPRGR